VPDSLDLLVIGAGMAGTVAANKAGAKGWRVAIVDPLPYGGTCALRGCDPKKILRRGAEVVEAARLLHGKGIDPGTLHVDWRDLMAHKRGFTDDIPPSMERELQGNHVACLHGEARFTGPRQVEVDGIGYETEHVLIATGARPRPLGFPGSEHLVDSTQFLELETLPHRIVFVGGGYIAFEFAHIAAHAGAECIIVDRGQRPLPQFDPDLVELLVDRTRHDGIDVRRGTEVAGVERVGSEYRVSLNRDGERSMLTADLVVHAAGREPDLERLRLDAAEIAAGPDGVQVSEHLQSTTNPAVYAAGDAAQTPAARLTPVAVIEGKVAASNMLKGTRTAPDYTGVPSTVFTLPELNRVGLLEHEARDRGLDIDVRYTDTRGWYSNYRIGETTGAAKILVDRRTDLVVGAHLLGHHYSELINTFGLAIKVGLTTTRLRSAVATYPSIGSDLSSLL
jgi:glutathione reductase (NADPH)